MLRIILSILLCFTTFQIFAKSNSVDDTAKVINRVIYITLDGVRWQDIYVKPDFHDFVSTHSDIVKEYGFPKTNQLMTVASKPKSLPSYQSQMAGFVQPCKTNYCGRIHVETLPEYLRTKLKVSIKDIAIFASWENIDFAAEHISGSVFINAGNMPVYDPDTKVADDVMQDLNLQQLNAGESSRKVRYDIFTFQQALHYFEKYQPKFLWISLGDADHAAHLNDAEGYEAALSLYEDSLSQLFHKLKEMNIFETTLVIITTDHGRGNGKFWRFHGLPIPASQRTWAFVINGELQPVYDRNSFKHYSTLSMRPTIEKAFKV